MQDVSNKIESSGNIPSGIVRELKVRAAQSRRKLKDLATEYLREGLARTSPPKPLERAVIETSKKTGLPVIHCGRRAPKGEELTPDRVAEILQQDEIERALASA